MFSRFGAQAFAERPGAKLLATGETARRRTEETREVLSPQEAQIAPLAADGQTNPEISAGCSLAHAPSSHHLRKVFPKLDINSAQRTPTRLDEDSQSHRLGPSRSRRRSRSQGVPHMADGALPFAKLETATADGRLCNCPILNGVASALLSATCRVAESRADELRPRVAECLRSADCVALVVDRPTSARSAPPVSLGRVGRGPGRLGVDYSCCRSVAGTVGQVGAPGGLRDGGVGGVWVADRGRRDDRSAVD